MSNDLHIKYRPETLDDVYGQEAVVKSIYALGDEMPHAFLFSGPSGVGKTTIARILAKQFLEAEAADILEYDAAAYSKVEDTRTLISNLMYRPFSGGNKIVILDECHAFSKSSWQALLKVIEEPPEFVYFALCTTELDKVPKTIQTRCHNFKLGSVSRDDLFDLVSYVAEDAEIDVASDVLVEVAREAEGSPRAALVGLSMVRDCETVEEAREVLTSFSGSSSAEVIDLCRFVSKPGTESSFNKAVKMVKAIETDNWEGVRLAVVGYINAILLNGSRTIDWHLHVLSCLVGRPISYSEKSAGLVMMLGDIYYGG